MNPPFSSNPIKALVETIFLETSTLPTLVRITFELYFLASNSVFEPEFKQVTTKEFGFLFKICWISISADLSPVKIFPSSSQKILRSPSPSNAIPKSALFSITVFERIERFWGVGSEPRPGNIPSRVSLTRMVSHFIVSQKFGAETICAPFPKSKTTLKGFDSISLESICDTIPLR